MFPSSDTFYPADPFLPCEDREPNDPARGYTLEEAQAAVKGLVEIINLGGGMVMLCNEEGLIRGLPENPAASQIARRRIVGPALVCRSSHFR